MTMSDNCNAFVILSKYYITPIKVFTDSFVESRTMVTMSCYLYYWISIKEHVVGAEV